MLQTMQPRSSTAFTMKKGERLKVIDPEGEQVADLYAFNEHDKNEFISSGRSLDYNESIQFKKAACYTLIKSNVTKSEIIEDTVEDHDFLLTPCSVDTFKHFYPMKSQYLGATAI